MEKLLTSNVSISNGSMEELHYLISIWTTCMLMKFEQNRVV